MNRPPFPPPYAQPPYPQQPGSAPNPGRPRGIRDGLVQQSQNRSAFVRDAITKLDAGFSALDVEAANVVARLAQQNPVAHRQLEMSLSATRAVQQRVRQVLLELASADSALTGELSRWIAGQPPSTYVPQQAQAQAPQYPQQPWPQQQAGGAPQGGGAQQAPNPALMPNIPPGQLDMRDPMQAAAAMLRAEQMPLGPQPMMQQQMMPPQYAQPQYAQPGIAVPPGAGAGAGVPQYNGQPLPQPQVPVQMQYADPSQAGPPNMPVAPPVMQYASPEAAQAAVAASHAAGVPVAAVTATAAGPVSPAANGTASKPATT